MKNGNNYFQKFPLWDINSTNLPNRSKLFSLKPIGIGSADVESFTSCLSRLAKEHCVSPNTLLKYVIKQNLVINQNGLSYMDFFVSRHLNGLNHKTNMTIQAFGNELSDSDIKFTTLLPLKDVFSRQHLIRTKKMWCPLCLEEQKRKYKAAYEKLIWSLHVVEVCSIHRFPLVNYCPKCNLLMESISSTFYGNCRYCYSWLGYSQENAKAYQKQFKNNLISPKLFWVDEVIRKIIESLPVAKSKFARENYVMGLQLLVKKLTNGNVSQFCRKIKIKENDFIKLLQEDSLISITQLINICYAVEINPFHLLNGDTAEELRYIEAKQLQRKKCNILPLCSDLYIEDTVPKTKTVLNEKIENARKIMTEALELDVPISFFAISRKANINPSILNRVLPELSMKIRDKYLNDKKRLYEKRWRLERK